MLDVHPPHEAVHTWKDFFIHIATICVGLLIAVGLEQSIEALHRHHEATRLRESLHRESEQIVKDGKDTDADVTYQLRWLAGRIEQVKATVWQHQPLPPPASHAVPPYDYPDDPLWRSAKVSGLTPRLKQDEVNAYSEIELLSEKIASLYARYRAAESDRLQFENQFPLRGADIDYSQASPEDMRIYLKLLTAESEAGQVLREWVRDLMGAEDAVLKGNIRLQQIFASEKKFEHPKQP